MNQPDTKWIDTLIRAASRSLTPLEDTFIHSQIDQALARGEVLAATIENVQDMMIDFASEAQAYAFSKETYIACITCLCAMDTYSDYYDDGMLSFDDILRFVDAALKAVPPPGPICVDCVQLAKTGTCPVCHKSVCRRCLVAHLDAHDAEDEEE